MKRSEINRRIKEAMAFFKEMNFILPPFAGYSEKEWMEASKNQKEILDLKLGWDITDFGQGDFSREGLLLFTLRNGTPDVKYGKPYAEKIMMVREGQYTPMHYHWNKMEDIINRGGGNLQLRFFMADDDDGLSDEDVTLSFDGVGKTLNPGETLCLKPGESVTIPQKVYHTFWGEKDKGPVLTGEVSMVNDDSRDNRFLEPIGRFPEIDEDEEPYRFIGADYVRFK